MIKKHKNFFGLTGSIGVGKSLIAKQFKKLGAIIIEADKISRLLVKPGQPCYKKIIKAFGNKILKSKNASSPINRKALRDIVFNDKNQLKKLNKIMFKPINDYALKLYLKLNKKHKNKIFIFDSATIFESKANKFLNKIILVYAPLKLQILRAKKNKKLNSIMIVKIKNSQLPFKIKKKLSHFIIDNSKDYKYTYNQIKKIYNILLNESHAKRNNNNRGRLSRF